MSDVLACSRALFFLACLALLTGCGDDASGSDGGTSGDGDGGGDGDGDGDGDTDCDIPERRVTEPGEKILSNLSVAGDTLTFIASEPTTLLGTIEAIGIDGEGAETLHTPEGQRRVRSAKAHGDVVYFLEENEEIVSTYELFSVPVSGGTAERIGDAGVPSGYIFGIDDDFVYAVHDAIFERIAIDGGAVERIGSLPRAGTPTHVQLSGDDIFFTAGSDEGVRGIYQLDKTASDAEATKLWDAPMQDDPCYIILGGLVATPTKLVCGFHSLATRDRDGTMEEILFDGTVLTGNKTVLASDGETFYFGGYQDGPSLLSRMTSDGEDEEVVACNTGMIANKLLDAFFPIANAYEVVVGDTEIYWIEQLVSEDSDSLPTFWIRSAAK